MRDIITDVFVIYLSPPARYNMFMLGNRFSLNQDPTIA